MSKNQNYRHPTFENLLKFHGDSVMMITSVHHFGTVSSFNPATQTASATIDYTKVNYVYNNVTGQNDVTTTNFPPIVNAPVRFDHSATNGGLTYPVAAGDRCEIVFNDKDMDAWSFGIKNQQPPSARLHHFSDAVIVVGVNPPAAPIPLFDATRPMLRTGDGKTYVAVNPGNGKIRLKNNSQSLVTLLGNLNSALSDLNATLSTASTVSGAIVPTTGKPFAQIATEISDVQTAITGLLE